MAGQALDDLIRQLARLPGLGPRSARRAALHLLKQRETLLVAPGGLAHQRRRRGAPLLGLRQSRQRRPVLGLRRRRARSRPICVVEEVDDLWAVERAGLVQGRLSRARRHAFGDQRHGPGGSSASSACCERIRADAVGEVILATSATVDGPDHGALYRRAPGAAGALVTRLAHGVPIGGELNYLDDGTLGAALKARRPIDESPAGKADAGATPPASACLTKRRCVP